MLKAKMTDWLKFIDMCCSAHDSYVDCIDCMSLLNVDYLDGFIHIECPLYWRKKDRFMLDF
jgi:hypothetical protein